MQDKDPVCGMTMKPESPHHYEYHGTEYRFCSAHNDLVISLPFAENRFFVIFRA